MLDIYIKEPNMIGLTIDGKIDSATMEKGLTDLVELSKDVENGTLFYKISNFEMPTLAALGVEFTKLPALFSMIRKYRKCAVLTDQNWIAKASVIEGALIPGLTIKTFAPDQEEAALAFLKSA